MFLKEKKKGDDLRVNMACGILLEVNWGVIH